MPTSKDLPRWIIFGVHRPREITRTSGVDVTRVVFHSYSRGLGCLVERKRSRLLSESFPRLRPNFQ